MTPRPDPAATRFTVVDWNLNGFRLGTQPSLLGSLEWDVACLQEVTRETWPLIRAVADAGDVAFGHLPPLAGDGPKYACAVLVRGLSIDEFGVLPDVPSPERAAVSTTTHAGRELQVCSWAAPPGVTWGDAGKGRQVERFAAWLRDRDRPVIVGIDRNAPKWERHSLAEDEWWNRREPLLYGVERAHDLRDAYRDVVGRNPALAARLRDERAMGPLAVTHVCHEVECRYDAVYASPEFDVLEVEHLWREARDAGSDHALVRAVLEWRT